MHVDVLKEVSYSIIFEDCFHHHVLGYFDRDQVGDEWMGCLFLQLIITTPSYFHQLFY